MEELLILEITILFFFVLYFLRPLFKGLWALDGLVWLPALGFAFTILIFPAYGFRPECLPLLFLGAIFNIANIPALAASAASRPSDEFRDRSPLVTLIALFLLAASAFIMLAFVPQVLPGLTAKGVETRKIRDESRRSDYFLRIFAPALTVKPPENAELSPVPGEFDSETAEISLEEPKNSPLNSAAMELQPIIFLIPPEYGSILAVDMVCTALRERGFTVVTYSRRKFDSPWADEKGRLRQVSPAKMYARWRAFRAGTELKKANGQGQALEMERRGDIEFLLPRIQAIAGDPERKAPFFLAGYGAGGSALVFLADDPAFASRYSGVKGIIAIESRLWSAFRADPPSVPEIPAYAGWFSRAWGKITGWFAGLKAPRVTGFDRLPQPGLPVLYLVSGRALTGSFGGGLAKNHYRAVFETLRASPGPAALAALESAGPLDFSDYPFTYPLYSLLFPGMKTAAQASVNPVEDTAGLICNFAALLLEREAADIRLRVSSRQNISGSVYIERRGLPEL